MRTLITTWLPRLAVVAGLSLGAVSAQAGNGVYWAVNVDAPVQGMGRMNTAVSNTRGGVYGQRGVVVYAPPPVVVYQQRPPVLVMPGDGYDYGYGYGYGARPVVYEAPSRIYGENRGRWDRGDRYQRHHHEHRRYRSDGRDDDRDDDRDNDRRGWRDR